ncbi:hypothetical protein EDD37DRAFT_159802 [Exophiala viscosa]|uniref:Uncharacterized protein n=1 Tax=Exophiala viscosa TaxID=2486360 RepID=A0AAN6DN64_9EURO|nr:hypothetical protein EDD36DRAFT_70168 [Exophiala viscosa]KAI1620565.1 hypothetical protein EDD37DRAFT_159802 [Exophiala viscosa]
MGGSAFKEDGLSTPRMPTVVYTYISKEIQNVLRPHFKCVGSAIEGPSKTTHGDVDILVADPVDKARRKQGDFLASLVGAKKWKTTGASLLHFAVPWPQELEYQDGFPEIAKAVSARENDEEQTAESIANAQEVVRTSAIPGAGSPRTTGPPVPREAPHSPATEKCIQVDIQICPTTTAWEWQLFYQAHGDLWSMLGIIIRRFGLTCSYDGLQLRIKEIESHNKLHSRVKMTQDPSRVLEYLGMDIEQYWAPFESWDDMMAYVGTCRFHDPGRWKSKPNKEEEDGAQIKKGLVGEVVDDTAEKNKEAVTLKHNDRARAEKRPVIKFWFDTYLPRHVDDQPGKDAQLSREDVVEDAKKFFGTEFANRFDDKKTKWTRIIAVDHLWSDIRKTLPNRPYTQDGVQIGMVMKGLKRELAGKREDRETSDEAPEDVRLVFREGRFEHVFAWAQENWRDIAKRQETHSMAMRDKKLKESERDEEKGEGEERAAVIEDPSEA